MRRALIAAGLLAATATAQPSGIAVERARLVAAERDAVAATERSAALALQATDERDAAARARASEAALAERVAGARAAVDAGRARVAIVNALLDRQRAVLAEAQLPAARLLAALQSLARRPAIAAIAQPGSVDDLVHLRAVLGHALPVIHARTTAVRAMLDRTRALQVDAARAARTLRDGQVRLEGERVALARLEAEHRRRSAALGRGALSEADRALGLGERARDLVERLVEVGLADATAADLATLPGPEPRPLAPGARPSMPPGAYRLPVAGRVVTGFGELADAGFRARGVTLAVARGAVVRAPAAGRVAYAARFRNYGMVVIIDHGDGWTTLLSGLAVSGIRPGASIAAATPVGRAGTGEEPRVTVELRRRGRPVDLAALVG